MFGFAHKVSFALGVVVACAHGLCGMERPECADAALAAGESGSSVAGFYAQAIRNIDPKKWKAPIAPQKRDADGGDSAEKLGKASPSRTALSAADIIQLFLFAELGDSPAIKASVFAQRRLALPQNSARIFSLHFAKCNPIRGPSA